MKRFSGLYYLKSMVLPQRFFDVEASNGAGYIGHTVKTFESFTAKKIAALRVCKKPAVCGVTFAWRTSSTPVLGSWQPFVFRKQNPTFKAIQTTNLFALPMLVFVLAGCGSTIESLGFGRNAPDEFAVVDQPPLSMPPDFSLKPPQPGAPRPQEIRAVDRAGEVVLGKRVSADEASDAEMALLAAAGADKAEPSIRETIDRESAQKVVESPHLVERLLWWRKDDNAAVVDAAAERERIEQAKGAGTELTKTPTPIIERKKKSLLGL